MKNNKIVTIDISIKPSGNKILFYRERNNETCLKVYKIVNHDRVSDLVFHLMRSNEFYHHFGYRDNDFSLVWFDRK